MIYLLRHGETEFNRETRIQGWMHSELTPEGVEQAHAMGRTLRRLIAAPADWAILSSPQERALRTAAIVRDIVGAPQPIETEPLIKEITLGGWEGSLYEDIEAAFPQALVGATRYDRFFRSPDGEDYETFAARMRRGLEAILAHPSPNLIVVSHGVAGRVMRGLYAGMGKDEALRQEAPQDAFFRLQDGLVERIACD